jgi:hypothetical protein
MTLTDTHAPTPSKRKATARAPRPTKPKFHVEGQVPTKQIKLDLKVTAIESLEAYAAFVGNQSGYAVSVAAIVERLAAELERDKVFKAHREEAARTGRPIGATAKVQTEQRND